jgi:hypothetical protein
MKQKAEVVKYWEAQESFDTDYDRENPVTRKEAMQDLQKHDE